jgi:hypothetical protein
MCGMKIDGQCHCGAIAYEAEVDPAMASICNCTDCQVLSGAPFRASIPAAAEDLRFVRGEPTIYVKTADNGNQRGQGFCGNRGTPLFSTSVENRTRYMLRLGSIRQRAEMPPRRQIWCQSALPWGQDISGVPGIPRQ